MTVGGTIATSRNRHSDWPVATLLPIFGIGIVFLGISAALFGGWLERVGPRKAGVVAALCWSGGFFISALGVGVHQLWLLWLGLGVAGGIGLGPGYISPVSTLIEMVPRPRGHHPWPTADRMVGGGHHPPAADR